MIQRIDNVGIAVIDFRRSAAWYRSIGFEGLEDWGTAGSFQAGAAVLYLFQTESAQAPVSRTPALDHNPPGIDHLSFRVADADASHAELLARGVVVEEGPTDQEWGSRTISLVDPDGNRIYLLGPLQQPAGPGARQA